MPNFDLDMNRLSLVLVELQRRPHRLPGGNASNSSPVILFWRDKSVSTSRLPLLRCAATLLTMRFFVLRGMQKKAKGRGFRGALL